MTIFFDDFNTVAYELHLCYLFGVLLTGTVIDNIDTPKYFLIAAQAILASFWLGSGFFLYFD